MNIWQVLDARNAEVRFGLVAFATSIAAFVMVVGGVLAVWLNGGDLLGKDHLLTMAWIGAFIVAASLVQLWRFARDGRRLSRSMGGVPLEGYAGRSEDTKAQARRVENILEELCIAANCPKPALHVQIDVDELNGFACGLRPEQWCITLTEGAVSQLDRGALQALVAHELAHLTHGDTRNAILMCAYIAGLASLAVIGLLMAAAFRGKGKEGVALAAVGLAIALAGAVGVLIGSILEAALSRRQEFRADAEAVRLTRDSEGMVRLLCRLGQDVAKARGLPEPSGWDERWARPMHFNRCAKPFWFDSHPPLVERIRVFDAAAAERVAVLFSSE